MEGPVRAFRCVQWRLLRRDLAAGGALDRVDLERDCHLFHFQTFHQPTWAPSCAAPTACHPGLNLDHSRIPDIQKMVRSCCSLPAGSRLDTVAASGSGHCHAVCCACTLDAHLAASMLLACHPT